MFKQLPRWITAASLALVATASHADIDSIKSALCPSADIWGASFFQKICWSQFYPIRMAGIDLFKNIAPSGANRQPLAVCPGDLSKGELPMVGYTIGHWRPVRIIENPRKEWCLMSLGGIDMSGSSSMANQLKAASACVAEQGDGISTSNVNYYYADLLAMFDMMASPKCNPGGTISFDLAQSSAFYPTWHNGMLADALTPESAIMAVIGPYMKSVDQITTTARDESVDELWASAGDWDSIVTPTGDTLANGHNPPVIWALNSSRFLALMSRMGIQKRTVGSDTLCKAQLMPIMKKSQYRLQMLYPVPQSHGGKQPITAPVDTTNGGKQVAEFDLTSFSGKCTSAIGEHNFKSIEWRSRPVTGEDGVWMLWQWVDCAVGVTPGS